MRAEDLPLALTLGDPAGIGPDTALLAWRAAASEPVPPFFLTGDPALMQSRAKALGLSIPIRTLEEASEARAAFAQSLPVLPLPLPIPVRPGEPNPEAAKTVQASIERAVALVKDGAAAAIVTNPISKATLSRAGFPFAGHTEYLHALAVESWSEARKPVMLLTSAALNVVPLTIHVPLAEVPGLLSRDLILATLETIALSFARFFRTQAPRIAVCGLNPHAGEEATIGTEESEIIAPAIAAAREKGLNVSGPYPADTLFHAEARTRYDVALGMYHDQVLVPFKTLAFDTGVNVTLGLPFIRTSPDHGTAFALAGTGRANPRSLIEALRLAARMSRAPGAAP